jgi:hypothetical protein
MADTTPALNAKKSGACTCLLVTTVVLVVVAGIAAMSLTSLVSVSADSTGFVDRGGAIVSVIGPGYNFVRSFDKVHMVKTSLAIDRYRTRARLADNVWFDFTIEFQNEWFRNASAQQKIATFVSWYAHNNSGARMSRVGNPDDSLEVEMLRAPLETFVPCILGNLTTIDIVDTGTGALVAAANELATLLRDQPIRIISVRVIAEGVEERGFGDGSCAKWSSWFSTWRRGKSTTEERLMCLNHIRGGLVSRSLGAPPPDPRASRRAEV